VPRREITITAAGDTAHARDRVTNVLHFDDHGITAGDPANLATDMLAIWQNHWYSPANSRYVRVAVYDSEAPKGTPPLAVKESTSAAAPSSSVPREVAICLSFYAGQNQPRRRGRIYLSPALRGLTSLGVRPSTQLQNDILAMAQDFSGLGGADVDWCVFSRLDNTYRKVTNVWVDNEWDTVRSRGMRSDARVAASTSG